MLVLIRHQPEIVEHAFKAATLGRGAHDTNFSRAVWNQISLAHGLKMFSIARTKGLDRVLTAYSSPPNRAVGRQVFHCGPVREVASKNHAGVTLSVNEFSAALDPVFCIHSYHQAGLVVECRVSTANARLKREFPLD